MSKVKILLLLVVGFKIAPALKIAADVICLQAVLYDAKLVSNHIC